MNVLDELIPLFFALNHTNYARVHFVTKFDFSTKRSELGNLFSSTTMKFTFVNWHFGDLISVRGNPGYTPGAIILQGEIHGAGADG